ncbi:FAD-dependent oxidoreductase [Goodfellowiella coeruleoviolacea]|uniref:2-polyprenyl-6-methoxyphenol hydroxylase n=1 Tax=Goodfellowiella coeruleoviolacea TaxID=334858 RepID=A0AAE3GHS5_9PSEU|nr:FAD-dependent oxidoreductase [Goodfellowiella coeruleoviolacea]MCP2168467.1 2-polyprenyl-6-methoxyphenol hydroxylase [Goodfellowiella coeruleoviolacea]
MRRTDVVVIGAGPTGLLLASELALQGVRVTVLERLQKPDATIKAGSINVASAEILDRRGLLPAAAEVHRRLIAAAGAFADGSANDTVRGLVDAARRTARRFPTTGHFAGMLFREDLVDQDDPVLAAHTAVANAVLVPQHDLELLLGQHCARLGVDIRRGVEVHGVRGTGADLRDDADVVVETDAGEVTAGWVVAADGGRSLIRKQLGIDFVGTDPQLVGYQAIVDLDDPSGLRRGWTWTPRGIYAYGPIPGRILVARFGTQPRDRNAPVSLDELQEVVREVTGVPVTLTGLHGRATRWSDNARQARSYRHGRVLLAGDAAHVHAPFSGQGLNLGLGDAVNLGWKLAATVNGWAPAGLLDTYQTERQPIAAWVLDWTRAQVALLRGDEHTARLRDVVGAELFTVPGVLNRVIALSSGIAQHYDVAEETAAPVGSIAGDVELTTGSRLADFAHDGRFVLVDRSPDGRFVNAVRQAEHRIAAVADPAADVSLPSLLVRPDGVIAWAASARADGHARRELDAALRRWAGVRGARPETARSSHVDG